MRLAFHALRSVRVVIVMAGLALFPSLALARAPAAVVIEVGDFEAGDSLAACRGVQLQDRTVFISKQLGDQLRQIISPEQNIHIETGLTQSEDISRIVLLRSEDFCHIFLAAKRLPRPETVFRKALHHDLKWSIDQADLELHLSTGTESFKVQAGKGHVLEKNGNSIRLHNYGRLALWEGLPVAAEKSVGQDQELPQSWAGVLDAPFLNPELVHQMIKAGADVNQPEKAGRKQEMTHPLIMVTGDTGSSLQIAEMLIKAGARVDQGDEHGKTALHIAARFGYPRFAAMLIKYGATVDAKDKAGQTPLFDAAYSGSGDIVGLLLESGANVRGRDSEGRTALHLLQYTSFTPDPLPVATLLLEFGADVNADSDKYGTPLHQAASQESNELAGLLISKGADVNTTDAEGNTPAHIAAGYNRVEILDLLKKAGATGNVFNKAHESPLHKAAEHVSPEAAKWLLDQGADIEARSDSGMTPLLLASITASVSKKPAIVQLLLDRGAKIDVKDNQGNSPLSFAEKLNPDVYRILNKNGG